MGYLLYVRFLDQYIYLWLTDRRWDGTCRQIVVKLDDGTEHRANFRFRRNH